VGHSGFDELACFERTLEWAHEDARVNLEQTDVSDGVRAVHIARAKVDVGEPSANNLLFLACVILSIILQARLCLLLIYRSSAELGTLLDLLQL